jgi:endogenous inhibitor of DNA gyrase (YacG/DUF329 family)
VADEPIPLERRRRGPPHCPICGRAVVAAFRPFCSRRCAERDLYRWLSGGYRVATDEAPDETQPGEADQP